MRLRDLQQILEKFTNGQKGTIISDCPVYIETQDGHLEEIRRRVIDLFDEVLLKSKILWKSVIILSTFLCLTNLPKYNMNLFLDSFLSTTYGICI
mgnify:CR=1 FL=1